MYRVEIDWAPAYELVVSLSAFVSPEHRTLDLGPDWLRSVRLQLQPELAGQLSSARLLEHVNLIGLLIQQCPGDRSAAEFLRWLGGLSLGDLYECLAPHLTRHRRPLPGDLDGVRQHFLHILSGWNEQYFRHVDPTILTGLGADAEDKRALVGTMAPEELVERATSGLEYLPQGGPDLVLLIPQYHFRPWNLFDDYGLQRTIKYPADILPSAPGEPPPGLLRMARTLADENRLRILRFLAEGPRSFTEVVRFSGLSKSTVHHHMVALRAAGLVRVRETGDRTDSYTLRLAAIDDLDQSLRAYLTGNGQGTVMTGGNEDVSQP